MERVRRRNPVSKAEFHRRLQNWFELSDEGIIGDPDADGRTAWVWVQDGSLLAKLHADTPREAVEAYLRVLRSHGEPLKWSVAASQRGTPSKLAFGPEGTVLSSFYMYVADAQVGHFGIGDTGYDERPFGQEVGPQRHKEGRTSAPAVDLALFPHQLRDLVEDADRFGEVVLTSEGVAVARVVPMRSGRSPRKPGSARGMIHMAEDFDETPEDFRSDV
jgi:antitoxin (DNA-binding transcriptional repressor) of toxin-antitoxin stability system